MAEGRQRTHAPSAVVVVTALSLDEQNSVLQLRRQRDTGFGQPGHAELMSVFLAPLPPTPNSPDLLVRPWLLEVMNEQDHQSIRQRERERAKLTQRFVQHDRKIHDLSDVVGVSSRPGLVVVAGSPRRAEEFIMVHEEALQGGLIGLVHPLQQLIE